MNSDHVCECTKEFTGSSCESPINSNTNGLQHRALPLEHTRRARPKVKVNSPASQDCVAEAMEDFYVDPNTGCKSKRKIKSLKCKSDCAPSQMSPLRNKTPFGYIIGTNKHIVRSSNSDTCCRPSKVKRRKLKLFCADGSTILTELSIVKKCTCSSDCDLAKGDEENELENNNKQRTLRHSYDVQT